MAKKTRKGRNPNNEESELFKSLTRLFSGPITTRRTQTGRQLTRRHLDMYARKFRSASGKQFKKMESYAPLSQLNSNLYKEALIKNNYLDF